MLSEQTSSVKRIVYLDRLAWLRTGFTLLKIGLQERLVYRFDLFTGLIGGEAHCELLHEPT